MTGIRECLRQEKIPVVVCHANLRVIDFLDKGYCEQ
jgi:hypothetical protein